MKIKNALWCLALMFLLAACNISQDRPYLPGKIVVHSRDSSQFMRYQNWQGFVPFPEFGPIKFWHRGRSLDYISPDGQWQLGYDRNVNRRTISDGTVTYTFAHWSIAYRNSIWSPDGRYLMYIAHDENYEWSNRVMVMDLQDGGRTYYIGESAYLSGWYE
jgi:hypothetical protein